MLTGPPKEFLESLNVSELRITRPRKFIFLCGGILGNDVPAPSAREALLRSLPDRTILDDYGIVLAEKVDAFYADSPYKNLIQFELDIAQMSDAVVLFSEGYGSLAELGSFSQIPLIAEKMMVLMQTRHYEKKSFIREGPVRHLEDEYPQSVLVFDWRYAVGANGAVDDASFQLHVDDIKAAILDRLREMPKMPKFDPTNFGHKTILLVCICEIFGFATTEEIKEAFQILNVPISDEEFRRAIYCATKVIDWVKQEKRGNTKYYLPNCPEAPYDLAYRPEVTKKDIIRWKRDIRKHWTDTDRRRTRLAAVVTAGS